MRILWPLPCLVCTDGNAEKNSANEEDGLVEGGTADQCSNGKYYACEDDHFLASKSVRRRPRKKGTHGSET